MNQFWVPPDLIGNTPITVPGLADITESQRPMHTPIHRKSLMSFANLCWLIKNFAPELSNQKIMYPNWGYFSSVVSSFYQYVGENLFPVKHWYVDELHYDFKSTFYDDDGDLVNPDGQSWTGYHDDYVGWFIHLTDIIYIEMPLVDTSHEVTQFLEQFHGNHWDSISYAHSFDIEEWASSLSVWQKKDKHERRKEIYESFVLGLLHEKKLARYNHLTKFFQVFSGATGSFWYDLPWDDIDPDNESIPWNKKNVDYYTKTFAGAENWLLTAHKTSKKFKKIDRFIKVFQQATLAGATAHRGKPFYSIDQMMPSDFIRYE